VIYVLQLPADGAPQAWFAFDDDDLLRKTAQATGRETWAVWDRRSARELLELFDCTPETPGLDQRLPGIAALGREQGWDRPLVRADALLGAGLYGTDAVTPAQASLAALCDGGASALLWPDEPSAVLAWEDDTLTAWQGAGWKARRALHEQLLATEALAEG
jgi:hypothetical protein